MRLAVSALTARLGARPNWARFGLTLGVLLAVGAVAFLVPDLAMAAAWESAPAKLYAKLTGSFFGGLATVAIVAMCILSVLGRMDWRWAASIIVAIVIAFSAPEIVATIRGWASGGFIG